MHGIGRAAEVDPVFCNPFDEALAADGPAAIFLFDRQGFLRFDPTWTRDAWGREEGPHAHDPVWLLLRDHGTGFVTMAWVTSRTLVPSWPRADVRAYDTREAAEAARAAFGTPPLCAEAW